MRSLANSSPRCVLRSLENPTLNGVLLGLEVRDNELHFQPEFFPCCQGAAERFDSRANAVIRCDLKVRFKAARDLLVQYFRIWGGDPSSAPHLITSEQSARIIGLVSDAMKGNRPQGTMVKGKPGKPGDLWSMALAAAWRFGVTVHMANFHKTPRHDLIPRPPLDHKGPLLILVEQITELWKPDEAMHLEALISFAYKTNSLLWLEFTGTIPQPKRAGDQPLKSRDFFQRKVSDLKSKSPLSYLEPASLSELKAMTTLPREIPFDKDLNL